MANEDYIFFLWTGGGRLLALGCRVCLALLGDSGVVISMAISPLIWVLTIVTVLITPLITTHELPSGSNNRNPCVSRCCEAQKSRPEAFDGLVFGFVSRVSV